MVNSRKKWLFIAISAIILMVLNVSGCASIPIPSGIPIPKIPILSWFI